MESLGSCRLIVNRNAPIILGTFITLQMLIILEGRRFYSFFEMDSIHKS